MTKIDWTGLMRAGVFGLRLAPRDFWALTPAELALMLGQGAGSGAMSRAQLDRLLDRYPDQKGQVDE